LLKETSKETELTPEKRGEIQSAKQRVIDLGIEGIETADLAEVNRLLDEYKLKASDAGKEVTTASNRHIKASSELADFKNKLRENEE
jgi:hypothetical protein